MSVRTSGESPDGVGSGSGTSVMCRSDAFQDEPSNWSRATIRRYMFWVSLVDVRYRSTSWFSG